MTIRNCVSASIFFALLVASAGHAQNPAVVDVTTLPPGTRIFPVHVTTGGTGFAPDNFQVGGTVIQRVAPLDSFSSTESANGLRREFWRGVAMAAALSPTLPSGGKQQHLNIAVGAAGGEQAVSINYAALFGQMNFFAGVASAGSSPRVGKIGVGYSW